MPPVDKAEKKRGGKIIESKTVLRTLFDFYDVSTQGRDDNEYIDWQQYLDYRNGPLYHRREKEMDTKFAKEGCLAIGYSLSFCWPAELGGQPGQEQKEKVEGNLVGGYPTAASLWKVICFHQPS